MTDEVTSVDPKIPAGYALDPSVANNIRHLEEQHRTLRTQMYLQYGVLALTVVGVMVLAWKGKIDATVATLLATLLGYMLRSTQDKVPPAK